MLQCNRRKTDLAILLHRTKVTGKNKFLKAETVFIGSPTWKWSEDYENQWSQSEPYWHTVQTMKITLMQPTTKVRSKQT